ncbi:MAG: AI-2E family transporter, partial [Thermoguttaceae bacterium]|nr:AI-2E family transporter [Thermoguttaceae bacterium]
LLKDVSVILAAAIIILGGLHSVGSILSQIFLAAFFAAMLTLPMGWLRSKGWSQSLSLTTVILFVLLIGGATITVIGAQLKQFAEDVPAYRDRFNTELAKYNIDLGDALPFFDEKDEETTGNEQEKSDEETSEASLTLESRVRAEVDRALSEKSKEERRGAEESENSSGTGAWEPKNSPIAQVAYRTQDNGATLSDLQDWVAEDETASLDGENLETTAPVEETSVDELWAAEAENGETNDETLDAKSEEDAEDASEEPFQELDAAPSVGVEAASNELFGYVLRLTNELTIFASNSFIVTLLVIFMLCETAAMPKKMAAALGKRSFVNEHIQHVVADIRNYMVIKTWMSLGVGTCVTLLLIVSDVQYPLLWGFVAFLLNYIPNIGSVVAAIPPIILATVDHGLVVGAIDAVVFVLINCTIGYAIEPRLLGNGLDLSPLIVLIALILFGWLLGPIGMFLSPPLAVIMKIIFQSFPETRWIAVLMANRPPKDDGVSDDGAKVKARV